MNLLSLWNRISAKGDLLGLTVFVAAVFHTTLIFGVGFAQEQRERGQVLDVTLASFKDDKEPENADFIAQENQQGSGTEERKMTPKVTQPAVFQEENINKNVMPTPEVEQQQEEQEVQYKSLTTTSETQDKETKELDKKKQQKEEQQTTPQSDWSAKIASLEAQIAQEEQAYAKRPKVLQITSTATKKDKGAAYQEEWRKIIERVGNLNYPKEASRKKIHGSLRLLVSINKTGQLHRVEVLKSSGYPVLDRAATRIVHMAAPFPPFPKELADSADRVEIIRTWLFDRSDKLSTDE